MYECVCVCMSVCMCVCVRLILNDLLWGDMKRGVTVGEK